MLGKRFVKKTMYAYSILLGRLQQLQHSDVMAMVHVGLVWPVTMI
jgi:hypothetical protein